MKEGKQKKGSALIVSMLVLMIIVTIALSITVVSLQNETASEGEYMSSRSFQTADTGVESLMYDLTKAGKANVSDLNHCNVQSGLIEDGNYSAELLKSDGSSINCSQSSVPTSDVVSVKSVSNLVTQSRAVEADVACRSPFKADSNTVALYHFQESSSNLSQISDASGISVPAPNPGDTTDNSGAVASGGTVSSVAGICKARYFDGQPSDYIKVQGDNPNNTTLQLTGSMTIEVWVKINPPVGSNWERIAGKGGDAARNYDLGVSNNGWEFKVNNGSGSTCDVTKNVSDADQWHFVAGVYDGSKIKIYIDGVEESRNDCNSPAVTDTSDMTIGNSPGVSNSSPFKGTIDEVIISKDSKSDSDITDDFNKGKIFHLNPAWN